MSDKNKNKKSSNIVWHEINVSDNRRWNNQEWKIQRHWHHWAEDTGRRQTKHNTTQHMKIKWQQHRPRICNDLIASWVY